MTGPDEHEHVWCLYHGQGHGPDQWGDLCRAGGDPRGDEAFTRRYETFQAAWKTADDTDRQRRRRPWRWLKRATVCWWRHRIRKVGDGAYLSHQCWACTGR